MQPTVIRGDLRGDVRKPLVMRVSHSCTVSVSGVREGYIPRRSLPSAVGRLARDSAVRPGFDVDQGLEWSRGTRLRRHGKEGVAGSSPAEGFAEPTGNGGFFMRRVGVRGPLWAAGQPRGQPAA